MFIGLGQDQRLHIQHAIKRILLNIIPALNITLQNPQNPAHDLRDYKSFMSTPHNPQDRINAKSKTFHFRKLSPQKRNNNNSTHQTNLCAISKNTPVLRPLSISLISYWRWWRIRFVSLLTRQPHTQTSLPTRRRLRKWRWKWAKFCVKKTKKDWCAAAAASACSLICNFAIGFFSLLPFAAVHLCLCVCRSICAFQFVLGPAIAENGSL